MRRTVSMFIAATMLLFVAACAAPAPSGSGEAAPAGEPAAVGEPKAGGTLTVVLDGEIDTIDPHKSVTIVGSQVWPNIFESLVKQTANLDAVEPLLAESWEQPDDVTYIFKLREGVKFHNGKDFKAEDVKYSFDRVMDEATGASRRPDFLPVKSVEVVDDYTVKFTMNAPYGPILSKLENLAIMPSNQTTDPAQDPIGTGPFKFKDGSPGRASRWTKTRTTGSRGSPIWTASSIARLRSLRRASSSCRPATWTCSTPCRPRMWRRWRPTRTSPSIATPA